MLAGFMQGVPAAAWQGTEESSSSCSTVLAKTQAQTASVASVVPRLVGFANRRTSTLYQAQQQTRAVKTADYQLSQKTSISSPFSAPSSKSSEAPLAGRARGSWPQTNTIDERMWSIRNGAPVGFCNQSGGTQRAGQSVLGASRETSEWGSTMSRRCP